MRVRHTIKVKEYVSVPVQANQLSQLERLNVSGAISDQNLVSATLVLLDRNCLNEKEARLGWQEEKNNLSSTT